MIMKTTSKITTILFLATLSVSSVLKADEVILQVTKPSSAMEGVERELNLAQFKAEKPSVFAEGTERQLSLEQITELLPWAKDSKDSLVDLLDSSVILGSADKLDNLSEGIRRIVGDSGKKQPELFMRYVLNRAILLDNTLKKEVNDLQVGAADVRIRMLTSSIKMAIRYYDTDVAVLTKRAQSPFARFGVEYFNFLTELNKSIIDASAQYMVHKISLEFLQNDLYKDLNNQVYAPRIYKINSTLRTYPEKAPSDARSLALIKQMRNLNKQLDLGSITYR
jgi:hypothetical protein